jgi:hypothetical protein
MSGFPSWGFFAASRSWRVDLFVGIRLGEVVEVVEVVELVEAGGAREGKI